MSNHYFIISEAYFFDNKNDESVRDFVSDTGIDLDQPCQSRMPSLLEIRKALMEFGLDTKEIYNQDNRLELSAMKDENVGLWLIFTDIEDETTPVNMFEAGRGTDSELILDFVKFLGRRHGNFLYYFDGGVKTLIKVEENQGR